MLNRTQYLGAATNPLVAPRLRTHAKLLAIARLPMTWCAGLLYSASPDPAVAGAFMPKSAELNTQTEALRDGEKSINKRYRTQPGALVFTTAAGGLDLGQLVGVLLATVE